MMFWIRARALLVPLAFYLVFGVASFYLVWGASKGDRGLEAKAAYDAQTKTLQIELDDLKAERARWERRVAGMRSESVDRDLLDEEARATLNRVGKDEVMIITAPRGAGQTEGAAS